MDGETVSTPTPLSPSPESIDSLLIPITFTLAEWADISAYLRYAHACLRNTNANDEDIRREAGKIVDIANRLLVQVMKQGGKTT